MANNKLRSGVRDHQIGSYPHVVVGSGAEQEEGAIQCYCH
jgi:hypothetical protein